MKRLSEKVIITEQPDILRALRISLHQGNVVGIFSKPVETFLYLTAVEDIFTSTVTDQKIIVLKKLDLHGKLLDENQLPLHQIDKVRIFHTLYRDGLHRTLRVIADESKDQPVRIRKRECDIHLHELRIILVKTLDSGYHINIFTGHQDPVSVSGYIRDFDSKLEKVMLTPQLNDKRLQSINISSIDRIEFDSFFYFKGLSSKVFHILPF
jgi:hypothetical protein